MGSEMSKKVRFEGIAEHVRQIHPNIELVDKTEDDGTAFDAPSLSSRQLLLDAGTKWANLQHVRESQPSKSKNVDDVCDSLVKWSSSLSLSDDPTKQPKSLKTIKIRVRSLNGFDEWITADPMDTIEEVKDQLEGLVNVPSHQQHLNFREQRLKDQRTLSSYGIVNGNALQLVVPKQYQSTSNDQEATINVKNLFQNITLTLTIALNSTVLDLKKAIENEDGSAIVQQKLLFNSTPLEDEKTLQDYGILSGSTVFVVIMHRQAPEAAKVQYQLESKFFADSFNYNFENISDGTEKFERGGLPYERPCGSMRFALQVLGMFEDDRWLGTHRAGGSHSSAEGEWAVAYHGVKDPRAAAITASADLRVSEDKRYVFSGIYCTPSPKQALEEAAEFEIEEVKYKLIIQTRVDRARTRVVAADEHGLQGLGEFWTVSTEDAIRPYGICVYKA